MSQRDPILFWCPQIVVFAEEREHWRIEIDKASVNGNTDEQRCHALTDGMDVVLHPGVEIHVTERQTKALISSGKILLTDQSPMTGDDDAVSLRLLQGFELRAKTADQCGIETFFLGCGDGPLVT